MKNLLSNAVKFSPDGGKITVTLEKIGENVKIVITDRGIGIPKKDFAHIFERFYRAGNASSGNPKRIARRVKNKYIGRKLIRKVWKFPF